MDKPQNKYISLTYKLYTVEENGERKLVEEATKERPFLFISGFGIALPAFEERTVGLEAGADFEFDLTKDEAYGDHDASHVIDLPRNTFCIDGHFDHEHIFKDAIVPLQNEDGNRFLGKVLALDEDKVTIDMNHPLAGMTLHFDGHVIESREATNSEIEQMANRLSGEGEECGCGCEHDHCDCKHEGHDHCCGGHHHEGGHCCHHKD